MVELSEMNKKVQNVSRLHIDHYIGNIRNFPKYCFKIKKK